MEIFGARRILAEFGLFRFSDASVDFLEKYLHAFISEDIFENQFRSNLASIAAAEFSTLRRLLNEESALSFPNPVTEIDSRLAILTADTLRTRPCRTVGATKRGIQFTTDLFMFSGDASKAWYVLNERQSNLSEITSPESFLDFGTEMYALRGATWEGERLRDLVEKGFDKLSVLFGLLRLSVIRNWPEEQSEMWVAEWRKKF